MVSRLLKEKGTSEFLDAAKFFKKDLSKKFILVGAHSSDENHISKEILDNMNKNDVINYIPYCYHCIVN